MNAVNTVGAYLTSPEASPYRPALERSTEIIDGFQSPHGMELLATVDWLHRVSGVALNADAMRTAIASWPVPDGAAERKAKIFSPRHVDVAVEHLQSFQAEPDWSSSESPEARG